MKFPLLLISIIASAITMSAAISFTPSPQYNWKVSANSRTVQVTDSGRILFLTSANETDWWRTAVGAAPESNVDRRTGPVYAFDVPAEKTQWTAGVWIRGGWKERFQQGTIFIQAGGTIGNVQERASWLKAGIELEDGVQFIGSVVTNPYSDWAIFPAPQSTSWEKADPPTEDPSAATVAVEKTDEYWAYLQVSRHGPDMIISQGFAKASSGKGKDAKPPKALPTLTTMREVKGFNVVTTEPQFPTGPWKVGVMATGPKSNATTAAFADFSFKYDV